jgi:hypothetical protein
MAAFFSGVDDKYELGDPGIHLTVGAINTKSMRYEIAASVTGNNRRFKLHYDKLIDATPVEGVSFHEDVIKYVDYSTPATYTYQAKPLVRTATSNILKKLPPAKNTKAEYDSYDDYAKDRYGDWGDQTTNDVPTSEDIYPIWYDKYHDPFYYNDGIVDVTETTNDVPTSEDIYPIMDLLEDYLKQNRNDSDALDEMKQQLAAFLIGVEIELSS